MIEALLERALESPPERRLELLATGDEDEHARAVVLDLLSEIEAQAIDAESEAPAGYEPGHRFGPYRILRRIGTGGMGSVYLAVRVEGSFVRRVALKILPLALVDETASAAFEREQRIMAGLEHPGIARLYDAGTVGGEAYLAMEYVEGDFVDVYCAERRLDLRARLRLFLDICAAVDYAHRNLVVHRDLKPANILVTAEGGPRLLDFGIAKLLEQGEATITLGPRALTPAYASPEQLLGQRITTSSDVFSLGAVLRHLITGKSAGPRSLEERLRALQAGEPVPAPSLSLDDSATETVSITRREVAGDVDAIVLKALELDPDDRYPSVRALAEDIRRFLDSRPVHASRPSWAGRTRKFVRRHRTAVVAASGTSAALVVAVVALALMNLRVSAERSHAEQQRDRAELVTEFLTGTLERVDPRIAQGDELTVREVLDQAAAALPRELEGEPEARAAMLAVFGRVYGSLGLHERSRPLLETAYALQRDVLGPEDPETLDTQRLLAASLNEQGDFEGAVALFQQVHEAKRRRLGNRHPDLVVDLAGLARAHFRLEQPERARAMIEGGLDIAEATGGASAEALLTLYHLRGNLLLTSGRYESAAADYASAIAELEAELGPDNVQLTGLMKDRARSLIELERLGEAEEILERVLAIERTVYPAGHPKTAFTLTGLARLHEVGGDFVAAERFAREAIEIRTRLLGARHPATAVARLRLAAALAGQRRRAEAEEQVALGMEIWSAAMGPDHPRLAHGHLALAAIERRGEDLSAASEHLDRADELLRGLAEPHPDRIAAATERARWLAASGRPVEGVELLERQRGLTESPLVLRGLLELIDQLEPKGTEDRRPPSGAE